MPKLNLGCGLDKKPGWVNIDIRREVNPDLVWDLEKPLPLPSNYAEEILAKDVLEHISFRKVRDVLKDWYRVLKPGGKITIQVPDLLAIYEKVVKKDPSDWWSISYWIYGAQDYPENTHKTGFTYTALYKLLTEVGFKRISIRSDGGTNLIAEAYKE